MLMGRCDVDGADGADDAGAGAGAMLMVAVLIVVVPMVAFGVGGQVD